MFKEGDEVVVISPPDGAVSFVGLIGSVIDTHEDFALVEFRGDDFEDVWWCELESLELVPPIPINLENI